MNTSPMGRAILALAPTFLLALFLLSALAGSTGTSQAATPKATREPAGSPPPSSTSTLAPSSTAVTATPTASATGTPTPLCEPRWGRVDVPPSVDLGPFLQAVSVVSANDVWAAGRGHQGVPGSHTFIYHWDGLGWSRVYELYSGGEAYLYGISALSSNDVWAVGSDVYYSFTEHWDGSEWQVVPSPNPGNLNSLRAVAAVSANDVWAVGYHFQYEQDSSTLIEHWDGSQWSVVSGADPGSTYSRLYGVVALSANDVWAVGGYVSSTGYQTLIEHWDGKQWSIVPSPNAEGPSNELHSISAVAGNDIWAVGVTQASPDRTLTLHWNGTQWDIIPSPNPGEMWNHLDGVTAISANDVWAVGQYYDAAYTYHTLTLHWDGESWNHVYNSNRSALHGVDAVSSNEIWAVGGSGIHVERYGVPILFSDVPPANPFYTYVQCLACAGIVSGYPDITFRPNNNVTRGQLAKIATLAAGYEDPIPPDRQTYEDVPPGGTFWRYIEILSGRNILYGYSCGSNPNEPCIAPTNRPYYRPGQPATRGQIAKVEDMIADFGSPCPVGLEQAFEDVPAGNLYFCFVQSLYDHGVVNGYPCGGPGESCVPPENRPYFRPNNVSTRGQLAKMVGLLSGCATP